MERTNLAGVYPFVCLAAPPEAIIVGGIVGNKMAFQVGQCLRNGKYLQQTWPFLLFLLFSYRCDVGWCTRCRSFQKLERTWLILLLLRVSACCDLGFSHASVHCSQSCTVHLTCSPQAQAVKHSLTNSHTFGADWVCCNTQKLQALLTLGYLRTVLGAGSEPRCPDLL